MNVRLLSGIVLAILGMLLSASAQQGDRALTREQVDSVKTAILDEIYDYGFQERYVDISPLTASGYTIRLYIRPNLVHGSGQVIYKLPIGEVARMFELKGDLAVLIREPRDRFPPTSSSTYTLYLDDEVVCAAKRDWIQERLSIKAKPSKDDVEASVKRQRERKGTSQHNEVGQSQR